MVNNSQHCWMLHVASVCTPCYMHVVAQSLKPVNLMQTGAITPTMLRPFARGLKKSLVPLFRPGGVSISLKYGTDLNYISLQVISFVGAVLLVACTVSVSSFGPLKV